MEAAGLAIGAVSLLSLFKTCLELYDTIECGRQYGRDYEILSTSLSVERMRLLLWGNNVGLSSIGAGTAQAAPEIDPRLSDGRMIKAVTGVLNCMIQLFEDSKSLARRYGLQQAGPHQQPDYDASQASLSRKHSNAFAIIFKNINERMEADGKERQRTSSFAAAARWAIKDKKRFKKFVDDLHDFNDSLGALFPDIESATHQTMAGNIASATDLTGLQIVESAVADMDDLAEAASVRITEISQHQPSLFPSNQSTLTKQVETTNSVLPYPNEMNVERLIVQMERLEMSLKRELKGCLNICIHHGYKSYYYPTASRLGYMGDEDVDERDWRKEDLPNILHPSWSLMFFDRIHDGEAFRMDWDSESHIGNIGRLPGTRSLMGYAAEFTVWSLRNESHKHRMLGDEFSTHPPPEHSLSDAIAWLKEVQDLGPVLHSSSDEMARNYIGKLVGRVSSRERYDNLSQMDDLALLLNRRELFEDHSSGGSVMHKQEERPLANFYLQMIAGYELRLRMNRKPYLHDCSKMALAAAHVAERWVQGIVVVDKHEGRVHLKSLAHERQVDGLIRFAELMAWPAVKEMREYAEDIYYNVSAGLHIDVYLRDWIFGAVMAGSAGNFVYTIMTSLVASTPSLKYLANAEYTMSGLVLENQSYWQTQTVLGRVFGGLRGVNGANGWVGPCPVATQDIQGSGVGWRNVGVREVPFVIPGPIMEDDPFAIVNNDLERSEWLRTTFDMSNWVIPAGPSDSADEVKLSGFRLMRLEKHSQNEGIMMHDVPDADKNVEKPAAQPKQSDIDRNPDEIGPWRAVLDFTINTKLVHVTLYSNPTFVTLLRCRQGPHPIHQRDLPKVQHIYRVSQLFQPMPPDKRVLVIDATGPGDDELAARAWCAEQGRHAIIAKPSMGTCYACTVGATGSGGIGVGCVIWT